MKLAVMLAAICSASAAVLSGQQPFRARCTGGPFVGSIAPTYAFVPGDRRNCRALPTAVGEARRRSGLPRPGRPRSSGYHHAGSQTTTQAYTAIIGRLQVTDPDLSAIGLGHVLQSYLITDGGGSKYFQAGWIEESGNNARIVFTENTVPGFSGRAYFAQYPLTDGQQYQFAVVSKPAGWYAILWWNNAWQELTNIPSATPLNVYAQQFLELYTSTGVHPFIAPLDNDSTDLVTNNAIVDWDTNIPTFAVASSPYEVNWISMYDHWQPGCWSAC